MKILKIYKPFEGDWIHIGSYHENGLYLGQKSYSRICNSRSHLGIEYISKSLSNGYVMSEVVEQAMPDYYLINVSEEAELISRESEQDLDKVKSILSALKIGSGSLYDSCLEYFVDRTKEGPLRSILDSITERCIQILNKTYSSSIDLYSSNTNNPKLLKAIKLKHKIEIVDEVSVDTEWSDFKPDIYYLKINIPIKDILYHSCISGGDENPKVLVNSARVRIEVNPLSNLEPAPIQEKVEAQSSVGKLLRLNGDEIPPLESDVEVIDGDRYIRFDKQNKEHIAWLGNRQF